MREAAAFRASAPITVSDGITVELALPRRAGRLAEIKLANHGVKTALIELHLEMLRGSIVSTCIKCDSFIYGRVLTGLHRCPRGIINKLQQVFNAPVEAI